MPRRVLIGYFTRELMSRIALCVLILVSLMEILALLEQTTTILERHLGVRGILLYATLRLPLLLGTALPLSTQVGALLLLTAMTTSSEIAILRAAGLATPRLLALMLPATLVTGLFSAVLADQVTPRAELALAEWWNATTPDNQTPDGHAFWFRSGDTLVSVGSIGHAGRQAQRIDLYQRDAAGMLVSATHADSADYTDGQWHLRRARVVRLSPTHADTVPPVDMPWQTTLSPRGLVRLSIDTPPLSLGTMLGSLYGRIPASQPPSAYRTAFLERLLLPLFFVVMLSLALPVVYIPPRTGTRSMIPVYCLAAGLLFVLFQGVLRALGNAGTLPALLAIAPGIGIFALGVGTVLIRMEDR
ncbi:LptF/LptG family permease [Ameyamaea chiangmaiensis]|uniref:LptF/LptG family permease n=2 Tax=Ameyamaea chiangmaiensis TaxID=442969 RepID=A0A850PAA6_9PROT|nr:LptF/LptG family permease [Ameyamaea chiangmaiensis]NVN40974.1 LptF/LptG family permease [Ameyamaea chiangmaiensis]